MGDDLIHEAFLCLIDQRQVDWQNWSSSTKALPRSIRKASAERSAASWNAPGRS